MSGCIIPTIRHSGFNFRSSTPKSALCCVSVYTVRGMGNPRMENPKKKTHMKKIVYGMLGLLMIYSGAMAQQKAAGDEVALKALEAKWDAANLKADTVTLGTILADTFITTGSEGKVQNKAEILFQLKSGDIKYQTSKGEVFHIVLSSHFVLVTLHVFVVVRIAKGDFDRAPHLAARNGIGGLVSFVTGT